MITFRKTMFFKGGNYLLTAALCAALAFSARAEYTCELSFPSAPATPLENFPVLVRLANDAPTGFSYADCPTGSCIWFTDENDNAIPCDVDTWDTTGESLVWVSVPSLSDAATITMHWDAAGAPAGQPASSQVWALADYVGVWHMNELLVDGTGTYTPDASASGWNAYKANEADGYPVTISDAGIAASAPPTGRAMVNQLNDATRTTGGFIVPSTLTSGTTLGPFTVSFFEECTSTGNDRAVAFGSSYTEGCVTAAKSNTYVMYPNNAGFNSFNYGDGLADNAWRHIAGVFDASLSGYVGGVYKNLNKSSSNYRATLSKGLGLGTFTTQGETFTGYLDEIRIRNVASTGEWIAEEYKTVTTANYVTFGDVEGGSGSVELLRLGTPTVSDTTAVSATVSGRLTKFGEGATSASVSLHYTDGGAATNTVALGSTNAVPAEFTASLANLTPSTAYTVWFSAVNNAETPASTNSVATVFSTGADATEWDTATATFAPDGRTITATVDITNVGSGTSTLYLMTGSSAAAATTVSASVPVTSAGTKTITADLSDKLWGSRVYYSLMLVNGTEANAATNTYNPNAYKDLQDNSTYTWIGGAAGVWNDPTCWNRTTAGSLAANHPAGYPVRGSTAVVSTAVGADPVTMTLPATPGTSQNDNESDPCWYVNFLNLANMHEPLTFTSSTTNWASRIRISSFASGLTGQEKQKNYIRVSFDHCAAQYDGERWIGGASADENGENFTITYKNGAFGRSSLSLERPGTKFRVEGHSFVWMTSLNAGSAALPSPRFEIDDSTVAFIRQQYVSYGIAPDGRGVKGLYTRLFGADAKLSTFYYSPGNTDSTNIVEFVIPSNGFNSIPLEVGMQGVAQSAVFGGDGTKAPVTLKVSKESTGLASIGKRGIQLVQSVKGINAANVRFEDVKSSVNGFFFKDADGNEYADAAAITAAGKTAAQITQIWYRSSSRPLCIIVR